MFIVAMPALYNLAPVSYKNVPGGDRVWDSLVHLELALAALRGGLGDQATRARAAIRLLHDAAVPITFQAVAPRRCLAPVALQDAELRGEIEKLRGRQMGARRVPAAQGASNARLRQRNQTLTDDNTRLRPENAGLKAEIVALLGERRAASSPTRHRRHDSPASS